MESLQQFLDREPSYDEVRKLHDEHAIKPWDSPHPHGLELTEGEGPYLYGRMLDLKGDIVNVEAADCHGQILCNLLGYGNHEIAGVRRLHRDRGLNVVSNNFLHEVVEWARAVIAETLKPLGDYKLLFTASGTESNDGIRRALNSISGGRADFLNLREGYSGAGVAASAACGQRPWRGSSTLDVAGMRFVSPEADDFDHAIYDTPQGRPIAYMSEAGNFGVGGFGNIPDAFLRKVAERLWSLNPTDGAYPRKGSIGMDEVQTGLGRTGRSFWASETIFKGMQGPDAISMAKGLGSNQHAAVLAVKTEHEPHIDGLTYHTFGQMVEDLAAMGTVVQIVQRDNLTENARQMGERLVAGLEAKRSSIPIDFRIQGRGLMQAIVLDTAKRVSAVLRRAPLDGWVPGKGGVAGNILRVAPPINVDEGFIDDVVGKITATLSAPDVEAAV